MNEHERDEGDVGVGEGVDVEMDRLESRLDRAGQIIEKHVVAAVAAGFVPVPLLDLAALVGVQLNMLRALGELYDLTLSDQLGQSLIGSLVGTLAPLATVSLVKSIPGIGSLLGGVTAPVLTGASTYAVGRVFVQHFESGGTFLTLDPEQVLLAKRQVDHGAVMRAPRELDKRSIGRSR